MELALRRAYGYAYGPKIRKRAGFGMGRLGDCVSYDTSGDCIDDGSGTVTTQTIPLDLTCPTGQVSDGAGGCTPATLSLFTDATGNQCSLASASTSGANVGLCPGSDANSTLLTDIHGNTCIVGVMDNNGLCPASPGYNSTTVGHPPASTSSAAAIAAALAASATAIAKGATSGSIQCGNGQAVAIGQSCPGAPVGSVCPTGFTLSGTTCTASLVPGLSNSTLVLIGIAFVALMAFQKK